MRAFRARPSEGYRKLSQDKAAENIAGNAGILVEEYKQVTRILGIRSGSRPCLSYADHTRGVQKSGGVEGLGDDHKPRPEGYQGAVSRGETGWIHR